MPNSVEKTMLVLRALSDTKGMPVTLAALSKKLEINKSTLSHILKTLCEGRYVLRVSHSEGYTLGPELYILTRYGRFNEELITLCRPFLGLLHKACGGTAVLAVIEGAHKYIIDYIDGANYFSSQEESANVNILDDNIYRTVTGRVLLAMMPEWEALAVYDTLGPPTAREWAEAYDKEHFMGELAAIRRRGYFYHTHPHHQCTAHAAAVPIMKDQKCIAALGFSVIYDSADDAAARSDIAQMIRLIMRCRKEAERRLAFE